MTVTLIAVYTPIGLQGGLTGSLFREFAFTLAGAVTISGVVALTLSPMLSSKLLNAEDEQHWLPAHINAAFERLKQFYGRVLDSSLSGRPAVYLLWTTLAILTVPMWMFSAQELAPSEDQGVIFGIVDAAANATLDQTSAFTAAANRSVHVDPGD
jgi:multidrug efflux pump